MRKLVLALGVPLFALAGFQNSLEFGWAYSLEV